MCCRKCRRAEDRQAFCARFARSCAAEALRSGPSTVRSRGSAPTVDVFIFNFFLSSLFLIVRRTERRACAAVSKPDAAHRALVPPSSLVRKAHRWKFTCSGLGKVGTMLVFFSLISRSLVYLNKKVGSLARLRHSCADTDVFRMFALRLCRQDEEPNLAEPQQRLRGPVLIY